MIERTFELDQATLIAEHTGFAGSFLGPGGTALTGKGGDGGAFSIYYTVTELKQVRVTLRLFGGAHKHLAVEGIPRGKRKPRRFPSTANEAHAPRSLVLRGWGHPAPPNPEKVSRKSDAEPAALGFTLTSADWNRNRADRFERYVTSLAADLVVDFPSGAGCD
jgi:hypothetical protein